MHLSKLYIFYVVLFVLGLIAYYIVDYSEENVYVGEKAETLGVVKNSNYVYKGTITGKSYTLVTLTDGLIYRLPLGERVLLSKGDSVLLITPKEPMYTNDSEIIVLDYKILERKYELNN